MLFLCSNACKWFPMCLIVMATGVSKALWPSCLLLSPCSLGWSSWDMTGISTWGTLLSSVPCLKRPFGQSSPGSSPHLLYVFAPLWSWPSSLLTSATLHLSMLDSPWFYSTFSFFPPTLFNTFPYLAVLILSLHSECHLLVGRDPCLSCSLLAGPSLEQWWAHRSPAQNSDRHTGGNSALYNCKSHLLTISLCTYQRTITFNNNCIKLFYG